MSKPELVPLLAEAGTAFARLGKVTLCILRKPPTLDVLNLLRRETAKLRVREPSGWLAFAVVEVGAITNLADDVREASTALERDFPANISVTVIEGSGFKSVAARAILIGVHMVSRAQHPQKIFGNVAAAVDWMLAHSAAAGAPLGDLTAELVHRAIETTRARV